MSTSMLDQLLVPGRKLVFCDDTDIAGQPALNIVPDLRLILAIEMCSELYPQAAKRIAGRLAELKTSRFHSTEIINPNSASEWRKVAEPDRVAALSFLAHVLESCHARTSHVRVSKGQWDRLKFEAQRIGKVDVGLKGGLKRVLVNSLLRRLSRSPDPAVVVLDREKAGDAPLVETWPGSDFLVCGGPIVSPSSLVAGLQLADLVAWSVARFPSYAVPASRTGPPTASTRWRRGWWPGRGRSRICCERRPERRGSWPGGAQLTRSKEPRSRLKEAVGLAAAHSALVAPATTGSVAGHPRRGLDHVA